MDKEELARTVMAGRALAKTQKSCPPRPQQPRPAQSSPPPPQQQLPPWQWEQLQHQIPPWQWQHMQQHMQQHTQQQTQGGSPAAQHGVPRAAWASASVSPDGQMRPAGARVLPNPPRESEPNDGADCCACVVS